MMCNTSTSASKQTIVVTGGTGYIGYALLFEIREHFMETLIPICIARASSDILRLRRLLDYPCTHETVVICDLSDVGSLKNGVKNADIVVHLASDMDFFPKKGKTLYAVNVSGTENLLKACASEAETSKRTVRFVYVSSTESIGRTDGLTKADESYPLNPESEYGHTKVLAERIVQGYSQKLDTVIVRPTGVYGPDERFFFYEFMQMVSYGLTVVVPSPMTGRVSFTHIDDVVGGIMACATHPSAPGNVYNICPNESETYMSIVQRLADVLKYPRPMIVLPEAIGRTLIRMIAPLMNVGKSRVFIYHPKTVSETVHNREYSNEKIRRELGFQPQHTILEGVEETLKYELQVGSIKRSAIPPAFKRCLDFVWVLAFAIRRILLRRHQTTR
ncbi:NAD-dependent epimerase/dehydratase [Gracilaria domingensis]|nr:NAD-dependent epimerase/dehydratase [Gracilaria domingensis]